MPTLKQRYLFIDLLRFTAVVVMLQGHTFDALLAPGVKLNSFYFIHDFFHGFVGPMFLFASGVAFGVSTMKKWEKHLHINRVVMKRLGRFIGLIIIGYALHLPFFSLPKILYNSTPREVAALFQVDALHCIAVTLMIMQICVLIVRTAKRLTVLAGALMAVIVLTAPIIWSMPLTLYLPLWCTSYCNVDNHSWYPLIPYSAFVLGGICYAFLFLKSKERQQTTRFMERGVVAGMAAIAGAVIVANIPVDFYGPNDFWRVNPAAVVARFGFLLIAASSLFFAERMIRIPAKLPVVMGSESLFIYIVHLLVVYGSVINNGLQYYIGATLSLPQAMVAFLGVFVAMSVFAYGWHSFKTKFRGWALFFRIAIVWLFVFYFVSRPY